MPRTKPRPHTQTKRRPAARVKVAPGVRWRTRLLIGGALVGALALIAAWWMTRPGSTADPQDLTIVYTTEKGEGAMEGTINSPLAIAFRIPREYDLADTPVSAVNLSLVDEAGNPALYGRKTATPVAMQSTLARGLWTYGGAVPSVPGAYYVRVELQRGAGPDKTETLDLRPHRLIATAETGAPLMSGYIYVLNGDLWKLTTDTARRRRLTFFDRTAEYVNSPAWNADGSMIAFTYAERTAPNQTPATNIWTIQADGSGAREQVAHGPGQSLQYPRWSADGKYLYFTVETGADTSTIYDFFGVRVGERHVERLDLASGTRTRVVDAAQMLAGGLITDELVYVQDVVPQGAESSYQLQQRLMYRPLGAANPTVLVERNAYMMLYAPQVAPDRQWVVFSAMNSAASPGSGRDFFQGLFFAPAVAAAHGLPWDLYLVPFAGGPAHRLTLLDEDEPYATWIDNRTLAFVGAQGLYRLTIDNAGNAVGTPTQIDVGAQQRTLTWRAP